MKESALTLENIIEVYGNYYTSRESSEKNDDAVKKFHEMSVDLRAHLYSVRQPMYNQGAFDSVISAIELNGITNFNMTTFWGKISAAYDVNHNNVESKPIYQLIMHYDESSNSKDSLDSFTTAFNCDSVGCIAGFALAEAVSWKQPKWLVGDSRNYLDSFEGISCAFLNIPLETGEKIFYGNESSVWAFVRYNEPDNYGSIKWENMEDDFDITNDEYKDGWEREPIALETISYKEAVDVLRRVANGEILIDSRNSFLPRYSNEAKRKLIKNV